MTHPIIKTDNYILITSDEEILIGDVVLSKLNQIILFSKYYDPKLYKKVIAHLPLNNSLILEGVPLLPPIPNEEDVYNDAQEYAVKSNSSNVESRRKGYVDGFSKAKEKYKFTEEDMIKVIDYCKHNRAFEYDFEKVMESLSQPKLPVGFKCEIEVDCTGNDNNGCFMDAPGHNCGCVKTKIINGVMQGEWMFE